MNNYRVQILIKKSNQILLLKIISDSFSLAALQGIGFLLSLATLPYLLRIFSIVEWGEIVFVQLIVNYMIWLTNWGFYLGATKDIASSREDSKYLKQKFSAVWQSQFFLLGVIFLLLLIACQSIDYFIEKRDLYYASFGMVLGNVLMPIWMLNGLDLIKLGVAFQILSKLLIFISVFFLLDRDSTGSLYFYINSFGTLIAAILMQIWMRRINLLTFKYQTFVNVLTELRGNAKLFLGSALSITNNTAFSLFIGLNCGSQDLALFNLVDRIKGIGAAVINPIAHSIYPRICHAVSQNKEYGVRLAYKFLGLIVGISSAIFIGIIIFSESIIDLIGGVQYSDAKILLMIVAISPVLNAASVNIANQILIANGRVTEYFRSLLTVTIFVIPALFIVSNYLGLVSSVILLVFSELIFLFLLAITVRRLKLYL